MNGNDGCNLRISAIKLRVFTVALALRFADEAGGRRLLLVRPAHGRDASHPVHGSGGGAFALPGGSTAVNDGTTALTIQDAALHHLRAQLLCHAPDALAPLEVAVACALQHRNLHRFVGGGTLYAQYVSDAGFQCFAAYVAIDVPPAVIAAIAAPLSVLVNERCVFLFGGACYPDAVDAAHRDWLRPLLRLRMQVRPLPLAVNSNLNSNLRESKEKEKDKEKKVHFVDGKRVLLRNSKN